MYWKRLRSLWGWMERVSVADGKDTLYNPTRAKKVCSSQRQTCRLKSWFWSFWTFQLLQPLQKASNKPNPSSSRWVNFVEKYCHLIWIWFLRMIFNSDLLLKMLRNKIGWTINGLRTDLRISSYIDITSGKTGENANAYFGFDAGYR